MKRALVLASLASAAALLPGCAALQEVAKSAFREPKLTFRSAALQSFDLEGATLGFTFDLENPNGFGLDVARLGYGVEVEGTRVAAGEMPGGLKIAASGSTPVTFPVRVRFRDVPGIVSLLTTSRDRIGYRLSGKLGVRSPVGVIDLPMSHSGGLDLPRLPSFSLGRVGVRSASLREVALDVRVDVANPNAFPIPAGTLAYALRLEGAQVARADGKALGVVPGKGKTSVTIPVRVDLLSAGRAVQAALSGGEVRVGLDGMADLAGIPVPLDLDARLPALR